MQTIATRPQPSQSALSSTTDPAATAVTRDAPAFDFYPERWLVGVAMLSDAEQLSYLRLLCHQWTAGDAGLPEDVAALKRLAGKGVTPALLAKFPKHADGRRRNGRLEIVRAAQRKRIQEASNKARRMAEGRWKEKRHAALECAKPLNTGTAASREEATGAVPRMSRPHAAAEATGSGDACALHKQSISNAHRPPPTAEDNGVPGGCQGSVAAGTREERVPTPALEAVREWAEAVMAPADCAEAFWNDHEARGWSDKTGQLILNFRAAFNAFATRWKSVEAQRAARERSFAARKARTDAANPPGRYG